MTKKNEVYKFYNDFINSIKEKIKSSTDIIIKNDGCDIEDVIFDNIIIHERSFRNYMPYGGFYEYITYIQNDNIKISILHKDFVELYNLAKKRILFINDIKNITKGDTK